MTPPTAAAADKRFFYDTIAADFDRIACSYDLARRNAVVMDEFLGGVDLRGRRFLDAGCGTGWIARLAWQRGADVTALDIGPALLKQVRRKCPVRAVVGDITRLNFPDAAFDVVVSSECIEHTVDPRRAVHELVRVCRPGGLIAITCPNRFWFWSLRVARALRLRPYDGIEDWPRWRALRRWVRQAGADLLDSRGYHLLPFMFTPIQPLLRRLDRLGRVIGPLCINQAVLARKRS